MRNRITISILSSNHLAIVSQNDNDRFILDPAERESLDNIINQINTLIDCHDTQKLPTKS